ncbi:MAG TPA: PspC domain-containing protein, partial [Kineosporiaceae bacterium]
MTTATRPTRRLYRRPDRGLAGGVVTGIAEHLGVPVWVVRVAFVVLAGAGGLGIALYGAYLIVVPPAPDAGPGRFPAWLEYLAAGVAAVIAVGVAATSLPANGLFVPALLASLGGALIWRQATEPDRERLRSLPRSFAGDSASWQGRVRLVAGAALVVGGGWLVLAREDFTAVRDGLLAMVVTVVGLALLTGPWWIRLAGQLSEERAERIRSQERADIAAHLHDSVLQTLALIQRNAGSPREVARLARGQERTLRTLLYGNR